MFYTPTNSILLFSSHPTNLVATYKQNISKNRLDKIINAGKKRKNTKLVTYTINNVTYKKLYDKTTKYVWFFISYFR